jgi:hypothetical protein
MARSSNNDLLLAQAIGEISAANKQMAAALQGINENLKTLNDNNILHAANTVKEHQGIMDNINIMVKRYWWLIVFLFFVILIVLGYKEFVKFIPILPN